MTNAVSNELKASTGYGLKTVVEHISMLDVNATGNADKAAWKRYLVLSMLAIAKAADKKKLTLEIFGPRATPEMTKTFRNMWSMAEKARHNVLGNRTWDDIRAMPIGEAATEVLGAVNRHMSMFGVSSKNEYDKVCALSLAEAKAARKAEAEAAAEAEADKAAKAEAEAKPECNLVQKVLAAAVGASTAELAEIMGSIALLLVKLDARKDLITIHEQLAAILADVEPAEPTTLLAA